jgi:hypothetical protein
MIAALILAGGYTSEALPAPARRGQRGGGVGR